MALARELRSAPSRGTVKVSMSQGDSNSEVAYLSDTHLSPLLLPEKLQGPLASVMVLLWNSLEHGLWELDVSVLILVVRVSGV